MPAFGREALPEEHLLARSLPEWTRRWRQLDVHERALAADTERALANERQLPKESLEELRQEATTIRQQRERWEKELLSGVAKVRKEVSSIGENFQQLHKSWDQLRNVVHNSERHVAVFREAQRQELEELSLQESALANSLKHLEGRFEHFIDQPSALSKARVAGSRLAGRTKRSSSMPNVRATSSGCGGCPASRRATTDPLERLRETLAAVDAKIVREGGATGHGWSPEEHQTFLQAWFKHQGRVAGGHEAVLVEQLHEQLQRPREDVSAHIHWHTNHEERLDERRRILQEWRQLRVAQVSESACQEEGPETAEHQIKEECRQRRISATRKRQSLSETRIAVTAWRQQRAEDEERARASEEERTRAEKQREQAERAKMQASRRAAIERHAAERREAELLLRKNSSAAARSVSMEDWQRIQRRSAGLMERRIADRHTCQLADAMTVARFQPPARNPAYVGVESRLLERTTSFQQKHQEAHVVATHGLVPGNFADQVLVRRLRQEPAWRHGAGDVSLAVASAGG